MGKCLNCTICRLKDEITNLNTPEILEHSTPGEIPDTQSSRLVVQKGQGHWIPYGLAAGIVAIDQITKLLAEQAFAPYGSGKEILVVEGWLRLRWYKNTGASFGLLNEQPWLFAILAGLITAGAIIWYEREKGKVNGIWYRVALGLFLGGTLGNLTDRLFKGGAVTDFLNIPSIGLFKNFNLADVSLNLAVATIVVHTLHRIFQNKMK